MVLKATVEKVNAQTAKKFLATSDNIRRPNKRKIRSFASDMKNRKWEANGNAIRFRKDGRFIDGQNRMMAVIESKTTQTFVVIRGCEDDRYLDLNEKRTLGQYLRHEGVSYAQDVAAACGLIVRYNLIQAGHGEGEWDRPTHTQRIEAYNKYKKRLAKWVPELRVGSKVMWRSQITTVLVLGTCPRDYPAAKDDFVWYFQTREELTKDMAPFHLIDKMDEQRRTKHRSSTDHRLALTIKAWNAFRNEEACSNLRFAAVGPTKEAFPTIQ